MVAAEALVVCVVDSTGDRMSVCLSTEFSRPSIAALFDRRTVKITELRGIGQPLASDAFRNFGAFFCSSVFGQRLYVTEAADE